MHLLAVPFQYLLRAPQLVIWNTARRRQQAVAATVQAESRREFLKGAAGVTGATGLLAVGVSREGGQLTSRGRAPDPEAESALLGRRSCSACNRPPRSARSNWNASATR